MNLEKRIFIDAQRAREKREERLEQVRRHDRGRWLQLAGGIGIALDVLTPPLGPLSAAAAGIGYVGHTLSMRRAEEIDLLTSDGNAHVFFSQEHDLLYRADFAYLPRSVKLDGVIARYHDAAFIARISGKGYGTSVLAQIGERTEPLSYWGSSLQERSRADIITVGSDPLIIHAYPLDG